MQVTEHIPGVVHFLAVDGKGIEMPYDDALVVEAIIHDFIVQKILVDDGSKVNLLPYLVFQAMKIPKKNLMRLGPGERNRRSVNTGRRKS